MGSLANDSIDIPVIDIRTTNPNAPKELLDAACRFGFVFVANNEAGISPDLIAELFSLSADFFALPNATKQQVSIASNKAGKNHGWLSQGVEKLDPATQRSPDVKEAFNLGMPLPDGTYEQPLPSLLQENIVTLRTLQAACVEFCRRILTHFATALDIPPDWFTSRHHGSRDEAHSSIFRFLYYPQRAGPPDGDDIRAGAHSDYGSITALFQLPGQPGLEILMPQGHWAPVPVDPQGAGATSALPILVNIGDLLEDWTGGLLKSTKHRVVFPAGEREGDRYSMAYFCHPLDDARLDPVPSRLVEEHVRVKGGARTAVREGRVMTARDHLMERLAATYKIGP